VKSQGEESCIYLEGGREVSRREVSGNEGLRRLFFGLLVLGDWNW
jgi:hypothetical protein